MDEVVNPPDPEQTPPRGRPPRRRDAVFICSLLFLSGFCGIAHEVLYSRVLGNLLGQRFAVNAALLVAFLLGTAIGTKIAHRLAAYLWAVELGVGVYGMTVAVLLPLLDRVHSMFMLGQSYLSLEDFPAALFWLRKCLQIDPWYDDASFSAGMASWRLGDPVEARRFFKREELMDPTDEKPAAFLEEVLQQSR